MSNKKSLFLVAVAALLCILAAPAHSQGLGFGKCPAPSGNTSNITGTWYVVGELPMFLDDNTGVNCYKLSIAPMGPGIMSIKSMAYNTLLNATRMFDGMGVMTGNMPGSLMLNGTTMMANDTSNLMAQMDFIRIDNTTMIAHVCTSYLFGLLNDQSVMLLSTMPNMSDMKLNMMKQAMSAVGFDTSNFNKFDNSNCLNMVY